MVSYSVIAPATATVGKSVSVEVEVCPDGGEVDTGQFWLDVDGQRIVNHKGFTNLGFCLGQGAGVVSVGFSLDDPSFAEIGNGSITFTEPGEYTFTTPGSASQTISVSEPQIDPGLVTSSCSADVPSNPSPGDQITLEGTVNNDNTVSVDVEVAFTFGNATETQTITVPATGQKTVTRAFTPDEAGEFNPNVDHTVL